MFRLSALDILIFAIYMIAVLAIGFLAARKRGNKAEGYFLARRTLPWYEL